MSKADEMFEKLGYIIQDDDGKMIRFQKEWKSMWYKKEIAFDKIAKFVDFFDAKSITMQELKAINEKVKELRLDRRRK